MATTPPLRTTLHTPPTPLHGAKYDSYQPYQTRQSTRRATQRAALTPPPQSLESQSHLKSASKSRKVSATRSAAHTYSPPSSTQTSPQKKLFNTGKPQTRGALNMDGSSLEIDPCQEPDGTSSSSHQSGAVIGASMLPTPAKTPRKKQVQPVAGLSRVLFPVRPDTVEETMPTPRKNKKTKRHVGFSLDSSMDDDAGSEGGIKIYTDSKDTVPELDRSEVNPFIDHPLKRDRPESKRKSNASKKRKAQPETFGTHEIEEAFNHEEGMVYVFRGRKIFKRFPTESSPRTEQLISSHSDLDDAATASPSHFTRSSIKPRLLFPTAQQQRERDLADEEATTDIEQQADDSEMTDIATDETEVEEPVVTPVKTTFTPASPPDTGHATRSATKKAGMGSSSLSGEVDGGGVGVKKGRRSPFDGWARRKAGAPTSSAATGKGKKRQGELIEKGDEAEGGVSVAHSGNKKLRASSSET